MKFRRLSSIDCVHMMAGAFILTGIALSVWVNQYCLIIPLFVGANLVQFGFTRICPAEYVFVKAGFENIRFPFGMQNASCGTFKMTRQSAVHVMAGCLTLLGVALGYFVNPFGWIIAAFVGANLFQFGITGLCPAVYIFSLFGLPDIKCDVNSVANPMKTILPYTEAPVNNNDPSQSTSEAIVPYDHVEMMA